MLSELRPIHFGTDLIFPPFNLSTEKLAKEHRARIKEVYDKVRAEKSIDFNKLDVDGPLDMPGQPHLWTRHPSGCETRYSFLRDRIRAQDEWTERTLEEFASEVMGVVDVCFRVFNIPVIMIQSCVIRATAKPHGFDDAREFLFGRGLGVTDEKMEAFRRPAQIAGINIVFPPLRESPDEQKVRIESYGRDPSQLFLEVCSTFQGKPVVATDLSMLQSNLKNCYSFMDERVREFVDTLVG